MNKNLPEHYSIEELFQKAKQHKLEHGCGAVPYEQAALLIQLTEAKNGVRILEIGTGIGYTAACMVLANPHVHIDTIDKDRQHLQLAHQTWNKLDILSSINAFEGKAHEIIADFHTPYDIIFFDAYTPQRKFFSDFERLLTKNGLLLTANLFLNNPTGGKYLQELQNTQKWQTEIVGDTAISKKVG